MSAANKKSYTEERVSEVVAELERMHRVMEDWTCLARETGPVTNDLALAVMSGRAELVLIPEKEVTLQQTQSAYRLVKALLETNAALQRHAALLAQLAEQQKDALWAAFRKSADVEALANFRSPEGDEGDN